jgi:histidyl-tRNA synthetase
MNSPKMQTPPLPKGTRDFYPDAMRIQNYIFDTWRKAALRFGYEEYEGPMFEHLELYTGKSGEEIVNQLYDFTDKGGRHIALRPEMTPTLARLVIQKGTSIKKPFKWFSIPRLFRYERAQKGRLREFFQLNLDIIGTESIYAEADLLGAIAAMLRDFGLKETDFVIGVSSRKLLNAYLAEIQAPDPAQVYPALDKRLKLSPEDFAAELAKAGLSPDQTKKLDEFMNSKSIAEVEAKVSGDAAKAALDEIRELFSTLEAAGTAPCVSLDLSVVRGLAYYTGIVFEVFDKGKSMRAIAGGGRYDSLCEKLGGSTVPGVGFGMGDVVLADLLQERGLLPDPRQSQDIFVATFGGDMKKVFQVATEFRGKGFSVTHPLAVTKLGKQMEQANNQGARVVVYVDGEKAGAGEFEYKNLGTGELGKGTPDAIAEILRGIKAKA